MQTHDLGSWRLFARLFAFTLAAALAGCASHPGPLDSARRGPYYKPLNFVRDKSLNASIKRVLVLPVCGGQVADPDSAAALDDIVRAALQKQSRFEVVSLNREDCQRRYGAPEFSSAAELPHGFLDDLGRAYAVDAVLFVDLTVYQPYGQLAIGFRAKLAVIQGVRLAWSFDDTFSSNDPTVVNGVRHYYLQDSPGQPPVDLTTAALQSPRRFAAYAADAMLSTLPPR